MWSRALDVNGAAVYQWCEFKSCRGKNNYLTALILTLFGLIFRHIYIYVDLFLSQLSRIHTSK